MLWGMLWGCIQIRFLDVSSLSIGLLGFSAPLSKSGSLDLAKKIYCRFHMIPYDSIAKEIEPGRCTRPV